MYGHRCLPGSITDQTSLRIQKGKYLVRLSMVPDLVIGLKEEYEPHISIGEGPDD